MKKLPFFDIDIRYLRYFTQHRVVLITAFTALLGSTLMGIIAPWPMKYIVDNVIGQEPFTDSFGQWLVSWMGMSREAQVVGFGSLMLIFTGLTALFEFGESYLQKVVQSRATFRLRSDVFAHIQSLSMGFHDNMRSGEVINRVSKDTERIIDGLISSMGDIITSVVKFVGLVITMLFLNWRLALIAFAYIPLFLLAFTVLRRRTKAFMRLARQEEGLLFTVAHEILANIRIVKAFGRQADEQQRFDQHGTALMGADLRAKRWENFFSVMIDLLKATAVVAIVWYGVTQIIANQLTVGELLIFLTYVGTFYSPLKKFSSVTASLQKAAISAERISELLDVPAHAVMTVPSVKVKKALPYARLSGLVEEDEPANKVQNGDLAQVKPFFATQVKKFIGKVEFDHVSFDYNSERSALRDVSFVVQPGQKVGIVGGTGAGKSTIMNLLMRFYDPTKGRLLIDGVELNTIPPEVWCRQVALVSQEPFLFATTIGENIAYGRPDATITEIMNAARIANAHDFIMQMPDQYHTMIGERGATLSGGQRQRLTLARAVLCDTPLLILDEPTSGLDTISEHSVMEAIEQVTANRTTFICTHRLSTIRNADLILVVENGKISEYGRHDALMANSGKYAQLWTMHDNPVTATRNGKVKQKH